MQDGWATTHWRANPNSNYSQLQPGEAAKDGVESEVWEKKRVRNPKGRLSIKRKLGISSARIPV